MKKRNNEIDKLFRLIDEKYPLMSYRTENGYLKLNERQVDILNQLTFEPQKHIFAAVTECGQGIKFYTLRSSCSISFKRYLKKCEMNPEHLPFLYLGISDKNGKINYAN